MAHGITRKDTFYYLTADGPAWHGLGTGQAAIDIDMLNQKMSTRKIKVPYLNPVTGAPSEISFLVTDEKGFEYGAVGADYEIYQDTDFWESVWSVCKATGMELATAGTLFGGRKIWALAKLPNDLKIANGDYHSQFVGFMNTFDGTLEVSAFGTTIRIVCNNTLSAAYSGAKCKQNFFLSVPHTRNVSDQVQSGIKTTIEVLKRLSRFKTIADALADYKVEQEQAERIAKLSLDLLIPSWEENAEQTARQKRKGAEVLQLATDLYMEEQIRCGKWYPVQENAYLLLNALTDYVERAPRYRGDSVTQQEKQFFSQTVGKHAETKADLLDLVIRETVGEKIYLAAN